MAGIDWKEHPGTEEEIQKALEVFRYWQKHLGSPKHKPHKVRIGFAIARFRDDDYPCTVDDLKRVIDVVQTIPYWMGQNNRNKRYTDFENLFRNATRVENFLTMNVDSRSDPSLFATDQPTTPEHYDL